METRKWYLGVIGGFSLIIAGYIVLQTFLFEITDLLIPMGTLFLALIFGLVLKFVAYGKPSGVYTILSSQVFWATIVLVGAGVVIIRLASFVTALLVMDIALSAVVFSSVLLASMSAICESWLVAGVQDITDSFTGLWIIGVVFGAVVACLLHWRVYGTTFIILIYVFVSFFVLNTAYYFSGSRIEVPLLIHLIINLTPFLLMGVF